jgi:hypothetical protein
MRFLQLAILINFMLLNVYSQQNSLSLTFEVENNEQFCLHHLFNNTVKYLLSYGVLDGGNLDISFTLDLESTNPQRDLQQKRIYSNKVIKKGSIQFFGNLNFIHKFCFSNTFSPISHKKVFIDIRPMDQNHLENLREEAGNKKIPMVFTKSDKMLDEVHKHFTSIRNVQYFFRYEESTDRNFAEALNFKVSYVSMIELCLVIVVGIMQVSFLKRFFIQNQKNSI